MDNEAVVTIYGEIQSIDFDLKAGTIFQFFTSKRVPFTFKPQGRIFGELRAAVNNKETVFVLNANGELVHLRLLYSRGSIRAAVREIIEEAKPVLTGGDE